MGYGALVVHASGPRMLAAGTLVVSRRLAIAQRLGLLRQELDELLRRIRPGEVVVEKAFVARNVLSALRIGEGRGVAMSCASSSGAEVFEITPAETKRSIVGTGAASKHQVRRMIADMLGLEAEVESLDTSDALALALAHLLRRRAALARVSGKAVDKNPRA